MGSFKLDPAIHVDRNTMGWRPGIQPELDTLPLIVSWRGQHRFYAPTPRPPVRRASTAISRGTDDGPRVHDPGSAINATSLDESDDACEVIAFAATADCVCRTMPAFMNTGSGYLRRIVRKSFNRLLRA